MANGQFDRLREIQQEVDQRRQEQEQEQTDTTEAGFDNLQAATEMVAEQAQSIRTGVSKINGKLTSLIGGQTDLLEVMLDSQTNLEGIQRAIETGTGGGRVISLDPEQFQVLENIQNRLSAADDSEDPETAQALQKQHAWEQEQARDAEFQDEYWRNEELDLLQNINSKLEKQAEGSTTGVQKSAEKVEQQEDSGGGMLMGGALGGMLGNAKSLAKLGMKFAGPLALLSGAWSFMEGFSNAESVLGRPAEDLGDKIGAGAATVVSDFTSGVGKLANMFLPENMQIPELSPQEVVEKSKEVWANITSFFTENSIPEIMKTIQEGMGKAARIGVDMLADVLGGAASMFFGDAVGDIVHDMTDSVLNGIGDMFGSLGDLSYQIMNNLIGDGTAEIQIWDAVTGVWSGLKKAVGGLISGTGGLIWKAFEFFEVDDDIEWLTGKASEIYGDIKDSVIGAMNWYLGWIGSVFGQDDLDVEKVTSTAGKITDSIISGASDVGDWALGVFESASNAEWDPGSIKDTAKDLAQGMRDKVEGWGDSIAGFFGFGDDEDEAEKQASKEKSRRERILEARARQEGTYRPTEGQELQRGREEGERRERARQEQAERQRNQGAAQNNARIVSQINNRTTVQEVKTVGNPGRRQAATDRVM